MTYREVPTNTDAGADDGSQGGSSSTR